MIFLRTAKVGEKVVSCNLYVESFLKQGIYFKKQRKPGKTWVKMTG